MGRVSARTAITGVFTSAAIPLVGTVYAGRPVILNESDYTETLMGEAVAASTDGTSAVLVVNLTETNQQRRADTGRGYINDSVIHSVAMEVFCASTGGDAVQAQYDYDSIIDAMILLIRSNPTMAGPVWSAGEYTAGVKHVQTEPYTDSDGLTVFLPGVVYFEAWQWENVEVTPV